MPDLTEADVREYLRQASEATPGPWWNEFGVLHAKNPGVWTAKARSYIHPAECPVPYWPHANKNQQNDDADFIAASRTMGPDLAEVWLQQNAEIGRLRAALQHIRDKCGLVCDEFELCRHRACQSSYEAWAEADRALRQVEAPATRPCPMCGSMKPHLTTDCERELELEGPGDA